MERFGACGDDLCGLVSQLCGEGERAHDAEDWTFTAPSRVTYFMQLAGVGAGVMSVEGRVVTLVVVVVVLLLLLCGA